jgi:hypothetical protein
MPSTDVILTKEEAQEIWSTLYIEWTQKRELRPLQVQVFNKIARDLKLVTYEELQN